VTTAFVFAGGGSLGAVEARMLRALVGRATRPEFVIGASVGAINAAYYAIRMRMAWIAARRSGLGFAARTSFCCCPFASPAGAAWNPGRFSD